MKKDWVKTTYDEKLNILQIEAFQLDKVRYIELADQKEIVELYNEVKKWADRNPKLTNQSFFKK